MARTLIDGGDDISAGSLTRALLNTTTAGSAVIAKVIAGTGVSLSYTGADSGTGDVTVSLASGAAAANLGLSGALGSGVAASLVTAMTGSGALVGAASPTLTGAPSSTGNFTIAPTAAGAYLTLNAPSLSYQNAVNFNVAGVNKWQFGAQAATDDFFFIWNNALGANSIQIDAVTDTVSTAGPLTAGGAFSSPSATIGGQLVVNAGGVTQNANTSYSPQYQANNTSTDGSAGYMNFTKSRGGAAVNVGDTLGTLVWSGMGTSLALEQAGYMSVSASAVGSTTVDGSLSYTLNGTTGHYTYYIGGSLVGTIGSTGFIGSGAGLTGVPISTGVSGLGSGIAGVLASVMNAPGGLLSYGNASFICANVAAIRALTQTTPSASLTTTGYTTAGDGGAAVYVYVSGSALADNGGTCIHDASGHVYVLMQSQQLDARQFGAKGDGVTDDYTALTALFTYVNGFGYPGSVFGMQTRLNGLGVVYATSKPLIAPSSCVMDGWTFSALAGSSWDSTSQTGPTIETYLGSGANTTVLYGRKGVLTVANGSYNITINNLYIDCKSVSGVQGFYVGAGDNLSFTNFTIMNWGSNGHGFVADEGATFLLSDSFIVGNMGNNPNFGRQAYAYGMAIGLFNCYDSTIKGTGFGQAFIPMYCGPLTSMNRFIDNHPWQSVPAIYYSTGTIATTSGSPTVTGTGTSWPAASSYNPNSLSPGWGIYVGQDPTLYVISSINAVAQTITLTTNCATTLTGGTTSITANVTIAVNTNALTVAGASFAATDVGKTINVPGAGASGGVLTTTIATYVSATSVTLSANASTGLSASSQTVTYFAAYNARSVIPWNKPYGVVYDGWRSEFIATYIDCCPFLIRATSTTTPQGGWPAPNIRITNSLSIYGPTATSFPYWITVSTSVANTSVAGLDISDNSFDQQSAQPWQFIATGSGSWSMGSVMLSRLNAAWGDSQIDVNAAGSTAFTGNMDMLSGGFIRGQIDYINANSSTTYTLGAYDTGAVLNLNNASGCAVTAPTGIAQGFQNKIVLSGGNGTIQAASGSYINGQAGLMPLVMNRLYTLECFYSTGSGSLYILTGPGIPQYINANSSTTYTLGQFDIGNLLVLNSSTGCAITAPNVIPNGFFGEIYLSANSGTLQAASGSYINGRAGIFTLKQNTPYKLSCTYTNGTTSQYSLIGDFGYVNATSSTTYTITYLDDGTLLNPNSSSGCAITASLVMEQGFECDIFLSGGAGSIVAAAGAYINGLSTAIPLLQNKIYTLKCSYSNGTSTSQYALTESGPIVLPAGSATVAPLKLTAGTNLTTAAAGAVEYDGTAFYSTMAASSRGVVPSEQIVALASAYTLTSQTAAQKLFNATTNGALTLPVGTYQFECMFSLSSMSATSGSFGFALGGTAVIAQEWYATANKSALATASNDFTTLNTAANTALVTANTTTTGYALIKGVIRVTTAGTIIPQVSLGVAAAAIVGANSYFKCSPLGSSAVTTVGNWS